MKGGEGSVKGSSNPSPRKP